MSPRNSFQALLCTLIALCLLSSACSNKPRGFITRQQVAALLDEMDKAAQSEDVETIDSHLSPNYQMKITIEGFGPTTTLSYNHDQYIAHTRQGFSATEGYDYKRGDTAINVEPDGQSAFVADEIYETVNVGGKVFRTVTKSTSTLKLEDGKLVITSSEGVARVTPNSTSTNRVSFR